MIRSFLFNIYFYAVTIILSLISLIFLIIPGSKILLAFLHIWSKSILFGMKWIGGMKIEFRGLENIPKTGPILLAGKHQSECDAILVATKIYNITFVAAKKFFGYPILGHILYKMKMIRADNDGKDKTRNNISRLAKEISMENRYILIYPEGQLNSPGTKTKYKSGIYYMYRDLNLPVLPISTCIGLLWDRNSWRKNSGSAVVQFHPPIAPGLSKKEFMNILENTIESNSDNLIMEFKKK